MTAIGILAPRNWSVHAKCRDLGRHPDEMQRDRLFPSGRDAKMIAAAKQFCHGCPVALHCLSDGEDDQHAVRAGLTADERRRLKEGANVEQCAECDLPFVPRPTNPNVCTGCCTNRPPHEAGPDDYKDEILAMHRNGATGEEICQWFGFTRDEIRLAAARWDVKLMRRPKPECGTPNGARAHYRHGQKPCPPCLAAAKEYKLREKVAA